jgi:polyisoprenyl-phosphate glycosyltransferase
MRELLSIVIPMHNEAANLDALFARLCPVLQTITDRWEIVCVNDGSTDDTWPRLLACRAAEDRIRAIDLSRNFGKEVALSAGLEHAGGDAVIPMDADLQHPPEVIPEMVARWREGYEVVAAAHRRREGESWLRRFAARRFYRLIGRISSVPIPDDVGDFRLLSRPVVEAVKRLPERTRFMKGLFAWVGFRQTTIHFDRELRHEGGSTWNYWKLWNLALDGIFAFSSVPLKVWSYVGMTIAGTSMVYAIYLVLRTLVVGVDVPGYASLVVGILFLGGVQLISLGVLGEYLARVYDEVKGRPLYIVRARQGLVEPGSAGEPATATLGPDQATSGRDAGSKSK